MKTTVHALCAVAVLAGAPVLAGAQAPPDEAQPPEAAATPTAWVAQPVDASALDQVRGGTEVHNLQRLSGTTSDNSAYRVNTGSNSIAEGSFANMSGLPVVIQNSGANVLIQNAVILNLQMD